MNNNQDIKTELKPGTSFDRNSGSLGERLIFNHRDVIVVFSFLLTLFLLFQIPHLEFNSKFESMIPAEHPFIVNFLDHQTDLSSQGNMLRVVVEAKKGTIIDADYIKTLKKINDALFLLPGVDRSYMKSLWTSATRWFAITDQGIDGGPVMPDTFIGTEAQLKQLELNINRSSELGQTVAEDFKSSVIVVPFMSVDQETGKPLDYNQLSISLEQIRSQYEGPDVAIHMVGFAKLIGDLIDGLKHVLQFFAVSVLIATAVLYCYTRCVRSTVLVVMCSLVALIWQLGLLPLLGFRLDPYSVLVPFLIFAIGMSHGAQKMNGVMQDVGRGIDKLVAARFTFRRLFMAGFTALLCDAIGFAVLLIIKIEAIQELAKVASLGVGLLIGTNLILLPVLLSYVGVNSKAAQRALRSEAPGVQRHLLWRLLDRLTYRKNAAMALGVAVLISAVGYAIGLNLKTGDLDPGAPELKPNSRYNLDNGYLVSHYSASSDVFVVMVTTPEGHCGDYDVISPTNQLSWKLRNTEGVENTLSMADIIKQMTSALTEGSPLWYAIVPNKGMLNDVTDQAPRDFMNKRCSMLPLYVFLKDHKAETLTRVVDVVEAFAAKNNTSHVRFLLAAGNSGIDAATNQVVKKASNTMLYWIYAAVLVLSFVTFKNWRAVVAALLPLVMTSILVEALMVLLGIGVKVATLPVTALGVGIGVDYALYILCVTLVQMRKGMSLSEAYYTALMFTGKVVILTGVTLSAAVATWAFSPIKFQADMGVLLAFMFFMNMIGALVLLPALAAYLLKPSKAVVTTDSVSLKTINI